MVKSGINLDLLPSTSFLIVFLSFFFSSFIFLLSSFLTFVIEQVR